MPLTHKYVKLAWQIRIVACTSRIQIPERILMPTPLPCYTLYSTFENYKSCWAEGSWQLWYWFLNVLQSMFVMPLAIGSYHLVTVGKQRNEISCTVLCASGNFLTNNSLEVFCSVNYIFVKQPMCSESCIANQPVIPLIKLHLLIL